MNRLSAQARGVWLGLRGCRAARAACAFMSDSSAPFAQQSTLGGSYLLRGFGAGIRTCVEIGYPY